MILPEQILSAWLKFREGKRKRLDVQEYERRLERNIFNLYYELKNEVYAHGEYESFHIHDPKPRHIRKASIKDRLVHQIVYTKLTEIFLPKFIHDSYSSQIGKGTHLAVKNTSKYSRKISKNFTKPCFGLKCDVRKFYDTVDHEILIKLISKTVVDKKALRPIGLVVNSFHVESCTGKGLPIGNLTSQIFTNIYLNELDQFIKHKLKIKYYVRFADDMLFLGNSKPDIENIVPLINEHLNNKLGLAPHPDKTIVRHINQGIDFLGYIIFPHHRLVRNKTIRRMHKKLNIRLANQYNGKELPTELRQSVNSYLGLLSHANEQRKSEKLRNMYFGNF
jgi:RNA-directed DNA polymerase